MLRPGLDFDVAVPTADSRIQALVEGALVSEEAIQRQALGLLVMEQFLPSNPAEAVVRIHSTCAKHSVFGQSTRPLDFADYQRWMLGWTMPKMN